MISNIYSHKLKLFYLGFIVFTLFSCSSRKEFEQYQKLEKQSWNRFNIIKFDVPVEDTLNSFDIVMVIRHLPEFNIKELPINVTFYMPSGEMRTANHDLSFTGKDGNSLSECLGDLCDISFTLRKDFIFPETGTVRIEIENKWTKLELPGILEVGIVIVTSNK